MKYAMQGGSIVTGAIAGAANKATGMVQATGAAVTPVVQEYASQGYERASGMAAGQVQNMRAWKADFKEYLEVWVKQKIQARIGRLIDKLPKIIKDGLEDPDMPRCISRAKDRSVDAVWPDIREEIAWEVAVFLDEDKAASADDGIKEGKVDCIRAWLRYHMFPYDKTIWAKIWDPFWVFFTGISAVPVAGICPLVYLFIFIVIDKTDEFQLIFFILNFKGTQFISHGIVRTLLGFFTFLACVTAPGESDGHDCDESGPGMAGDFRIPLAGFVLQVVLVWLAFFILTCGCVPIEDKGRRTLKNLQVAEVHQRSGTERGGYIRGLLYYDLVCFVLCFGVVVLIIMMRPPGVDTYRDWPVQHTLFASQVVYGYLSMPFFLFMIPYLQNVLTHAVPTAYNSQGACVKHKPKLRDPKKTDAEEDEVTIEESDDMLDKLRNMFMGERDPKQLLTEMRDKAKEKAAALKQRASATADATKAATASTVGRVMEKANPQGDAIDPEAQATGISLGPT